MTRIYVVDTNLFFECCRLEDLPWADLDGDPVVLALTRPVINEIDKHKKGSGRTRSRAIEINKRVRAMLDQSLREVVIRETAPRVLLRDETARKPASAYAEILDFNVNDDRIVGIAVGMAAEADVVFLTHDTGSALAARSAGLAYQLIPDAWRRPPAQSDEAKEIETLKKELAAYRTQEPDIAIRQVEEGPTQVVRRVASPLDHEVIDRLMARLEAAHPMQTDFTAPEDETHPDGTTVTYVAPSEDEVKTYQSTTYPDWLSRCRAILGSLHEGRDEPEPDVRLAFGIANRGTRPALHVRVTFEATGALRLLRRIRLSDEEADEDTPVERSQPAQRLPRPPAPPEVKRTVAQPSRPSKSVRAIMPANVPLSDALSHAALPAGQDIDKLYDRPVARALEESKGMSALLRAPGLTNEMQSALDMMAPYRGTIDAHWNRFGLTDRIGRDAVAYLEPPPLPTLPLSAPQHDPEAFYYDWPAGEPVRSGALTCDLFRHQAEEEIFDVEIVFPEEGDAKGSVLCTVHAENLTRPEQHRIPVQLTVDSIDLVAVAEELIEHCDD